MIVVLKILGWIVLGCVALCLVAMAVAFFMGVVEAIRDSRKQQQRRVVKKKRDEEGPTLRVVRPE